MLFWLSQSHFWSVWASPCTTEFGGAWILDSAAEALILRQFSLSEDLAIYKRWKASILYLHMDDKKNFANDNSWLLKNILCYGVKISWNEVVLINLLPVRNFFWRMWKITYVSLETNMNGYNRHCCYAKMKFLMSYFIPRPSERSTPFVIPKQSTFIRLEQNSENGNTVKYYQVRMAKLS